MRKRMIEKWQSIIFYVTNYRGKKYLLKNACFILVLILLPSVLLSVVIGWQYQRQMEQEIMSNENSEMERIYTTAGTVFEQCVNISTYYSVRNSSFGQNGDTNYEALRYQSFSQELRAQLLTNSYLYSIVIQNKDVIISSDSSYHTDTYYSEGNTETVEVLGKMGNTDIYYRVRNNYYPNFITFENPIIETKTTVGKTSVNLNCIDAGNLILGPQRNRIRKSFIVTDKGTIVMTSEQSLLGNEINQVAEHFSEKNRGLNTAYIDGEAYYYFQKALDRSSLTIMIFTSMSTYEGVQQSMRHTVLLLSAAAVFLVVPITAVITVKSYKPLKQIMLEMNQYQILKGNRVDFDDETKYILQNLKQIVTSNQELEEELMSRLNHLKNAQSALLQAQINPHFLYNTLDMVNWLAYDLTGGENEVSRSILCLSDLLTAAMNTKNAVWSLEQELNLTASYIELLNLRYADELEIHIQNDLTGTPVKILKMCLQPILENAVQHGTRHCERTGKIKVCISAKGHCLTIQVADNGAGLDPQKLNEIRIALDSEDVLIKQHIGMKNVHLRARLLYGETYGVKINSTKGIGTTVTIILPLIYNE